MTTIQVFDPALCCSTGVCGTDVDQALVTFSADVDWAKRSGANIERFNLAQQPQAFAGNAHAKAVLEQSGERGLPLILVDGEQVLTGRYPRRDELAEWMGSTAAPVAPSLFTPQVAELVAIGAAIASNCEPCFKHHFDAARKLGVSAEDMQRAVNLAQQVKDAPARAVLELAQRYLKPAAPRDTAAKATLVTLSSSSCCGPNTQSEGTAKGGCC